ncbi:MAG: FAD:protein FMN transferase [Bacillota bacterium]|jgi:thiamine biosynthesis lipoprotein
MGKCCRLGLLVSLTLLLILLAGCWGGKEQGREKEYQMTFFVMDTFVTVQFHAAEGKGEAVISDIQGEMRRLEGILSSHLPQSDVARIDQAAGREPVKVSPETLEVLATALKYAPLTDGAFDITLAPVLRLYNFAPGQERRPTPQELEESLVLVDWRLLEVDQAERTAFLRKQGMKIDLGGVAKGYIIDAALELLASHDIRHGLVNAGGDIRLLGPKLDGSAWRVGIKDPRNPQVATFAIVEATGGAIVTSGDYERFFMEDGIRYHHIIDPATGLPASAARSVTVLAPTAELADLLSTAIFVLGPERGLALAESLPDVETIIWTREDEVRWSSGLKRVDGQKVDYYFLLANNGP